MSALTIKVVVLAVVFLAVFAFAAHAESALVRNCTWCHGGSAQGYTPAPRLAGQRRIYIEQQLASFASRTRDAPFSKQYMWGAAANLRPWEAHALSVYFSNLLPRAADDGDRELVALGETIYQRGMPDANIAACVACHGPKGEGVVRFRGSEGQHTLISNVALSNGLRAITGHWCTPCRILLNSCRGIKLKNWHHI